MSRSGPPRPPPPEILLVDDHIVAVDKPAGVKSVAGRGKHPNLPALLRDRSLGAVRIVHRLDQDASGVIIYARTLAAQQNLAAQFAERRVEKIYLALASGYVEQDGAINLRLLIDRREGRVVVSRRGKPSLTHYRILERVAGNTWLECKPVTGRLHQIRAHLAAIGHPLAIDPRYGGAAELMLSRFKSGYRASARHEERPLCNRLTLHAAMLRLTHPASGEPLVIEAPLPKDLRATLNQLRRVAIPKRRA
ncbi:MAG: RluA family pseudouridine synthase [Phycisphaerae bacterium]